MRELPNPTGPLSPSHDPRRSLHRPTTATGAGAHTVVPLAAGAAPQPLVTERAAEPSRTAERAGAPLHVHWARHLDDVRCAQRLRYQVFATEMGAHLPQDVPGHDVDLFDDFCEHLLVRCGDSGDVVGTYRVLTPAQAKRVGSFYSDTEFDLVRLRGLRDQMVELGRSCVHANHRRGAVILALWGELAGFMTRNRLPIMIGCASVPMLHQGVVTGDVAASIWKQLRQSHLAAPDMQVRPRLPLPLQGLNDDLQIEPPALIKGYLRLGAKVLGAPAWDPDFNTADLPMMMHVADMPERYRRHFLG
jgi:putative hemolysin